MFAFLTKISLLSEVMKKGKFDKHSAEMEVINGLFSQ